MVPAKQIERNGIPGLMIETFRGIGFDADCRYVSLLRVPEAVTLCVTVFGLVRIRPKIERSHGLRNWSKERCRPGSLPAD